MDTLAVVSEIEALLLINDNLESICTVLALIFIGKVIKTLCEM